MTAALAPHPESLLMLLADARLPSGGHAYSGGMEPALLGGLDPRLVPDYLIGRARTSGIVDAGTAVVARAAALSLPPREGLRRAAAAWAARTPSAAQRAASRQVGRGYLRVSAGLWPDHPAVRAALDTAPLPRPVMLGIMAASAAIAPTALARLCVYDDAQSAASALLKLEPLDPVLPTRWVIDACAAAEELLPLAVAATEPDAIPAFGAPQSEDWAEAHALLTQRLFHA